MLNAAAWEEKGSSPVFVRRCVTYRLHSFSFSCTLITLTKKGFSFWYYCPFITTLLRVQDQNSVATEKKIDRLNLIFLGEECTCMYQNDQLIRCMNFLNSTEVQSKRPILCNTCNTSHANRVIGRLIKFQSNLHVSLSLLNVHSNFSKLSSLTCMVVVFIIVIIATVRVTFREPEKCSGLVSHDKFPSSDDVTSLRPCQ